jgi:hypothetical protein
MTARPRLSLATESYSRIKVRTQNLEAGVEGENGSSELIRRFSSP